MIHQQSWIWRRPPVTIDIITVEEGITVAVDLGRLHRIWIDAHESVKCGGGFTVVGDGDVVAASSVGTSFNEKQHDFALSAIAAARDGGGSGRFLWRCAVKIWQELELQREWEKSRVEKYFAAAGNGKNSFWCIFGAAR
ncbi:hypothetical protein PR202_ga16919 [Eleusine coracana subsp. coracana]|uniref:RNase H type-1 domain-containing protein n=1 Tax=Eleusine coracana subsp. coracana TaxID=191504 RepID=A0AAV5CNN0_ELECO|nr:hypothetical protein PR202_ga16919 [Eleusine coracana subsp. coracana]